MRLPKIALAVLSLFVFKAPLPAAELNSVRAADIQVLAADFRLASPDPMADGFYPQSGPDPVVITVPGLSFAEIGPAPFELKYLFKLVSFFFPKKRITEAQLAPGYEQAMREFYLLGPDDPLPASPARATRVPDNYLEEKLKDLPGYAQHDLVVVPFHWSRDPDDTEATLPVLQKFIANVCELYKNTGRPVYILAHSWGTVLSHTALHRLNAERPDLKVARWLTLGSPLMPGNAVVGMFVKVGVWKEHFEKVVSKPANVAQWRNIWASRDILSNGVKPADVNIQVDTPAQEVEPKVISLLTDKVLKKAARRDLLTLRNPGDWHGAYFYDYRAHLNSLNEDFFVPVFEPVLAPHVTGVAAN